MDRFRIKDVLVAAAGLVSLLYLVNPTAGVFELIPDNFPFIGKLDEAAAAALLLAVFRYFGIDLTAFLGKGLKDPDASGGSR